MTQHLITRQEWGARYSDGFRDRPLPVTEFWLHHSVTVAPDLVEPFTDDDEAVRTLERIGQQRFGGGISYNFPVTPVGRIYQGVSMHRVGAHTYMHNTVGAAFVLVGDYSTRVPTDAQRDAIAERMVIEHRAGRANRHTLNGGHRDASSNSTSCPGNGGHSAIADINARAERLWAAGPAGSGGGTAPKPPAGGGASSGLVVDGIWGPNTSRRLQQVLGTTADGIISGQNAYVIGHSPGLKTSLGWRIGTGGSNVIRALQRFLKAKGRNPGTIDGLMGPNTIRALQQYLGTYADGVISDPSTVVRALQRRLNTGRL